MDGFLIFNPTNFHNLGRLNMEIMAKEHKLCWVSGDGDTAESQDLEPWVQLSDISCTSCVILGIQISEPTSFFCKAWVAFICSSMVIFKQNEIINVKACLTLKMFVNTRIIAFYRLLFWWSTETMSYRLLLGSSHTASRIGCVTWLGEWNGSRWDAGKHLHPGACLKKKLHFLKLKLGFRVKRGKKKALPSMTG